MSDIEIMAKEAMLNKLTEVFMANYTIDEIATIWRENVYCNICPYYDICGQISTGLYCELELIKKFEQDALSKEGS